MRITKLTALMGVGVILFANTISAVALGLPEVRKNDLFTGVDSISGESCSVLIKRDLSRSIWGSVIELQYTVGQRAQSFRVVNHPFIGGNSFGKETYTTSVRTDENGVSYSLLDTFWLQLNLTENSREAELTYSHLGTSRGGLMIGDARGDETRCVLRRH